MNVGKSVRLALEALRDNDLDTGMLHACNAFDGTAKKVFPHNGVASRFKELFRSRARTVESFAIPWMDLRGSRLAVKFTPESEPTPKDFAEMIYTMHRCYQGHGDEVPFNWQMFKVDEGAHGSFMLRTAESISIPSTFIEALCAVAILEPANKDQRVGVPLRITAEMVDWGKQDTFMCLLEVDAWWGQQGLFDQYLAKYPRRLMTASTPDYESGDTPPPPGSELGFHMESISSHESVKLDELPVPEGIAIDFTPTLMPGWSRTASTPLAD